MFIRMLLINKFKPFSKHNFYNPKTPQNCSKLWIFIGYLLTYVKQTLKNTRQNIKEIAKIYFFLSFYVCYKMYRLGDETDSAI